MACFWSFTVFGQFASTRSGPRSTRPCSVTKTASGAERSRYPMRFAGQLAERFLTSSSIAGWPSEVSRCEGAAIRKSSLAPTLHGHLLVGEAAPTGAVFELAGTAVALQRAPKDKPSIATPAGPTLASASPNRPDLLWLTRHLTPHRACVVLLWSATSRMLDLNLPAVCDVSEQAADKAGAPVWPGRALPPCRLRPAALSTKHLEVPLHHENQRALSRKRSRESGVPDRISRWLRSPTAVIASRPRSRYRKLAPRRSRPATLTCCPRCGVERH